MSALVASCDVWPANVDSADQQNWNINMRFHGECGSSCTFTFVCVFMSDECVTPAIGLCLSAYSSVYLCLSVCIYLTQTDRHTDNIQNTHARTHTHTHTHTHTRTHTHTHTYLGIKVLAKLWPTVIHKTRYPDRRTGELNQTQRPHKRGTARSSGPSPSHRQTLTHFAHRRFLAPSSKLCQNWLRHWTSTISLFLRAAVNQLLCQRPPNGLVQLRMWRKQSV